MVEEWLSECSSHDCCPTNKQSFLPTRLLDLNDVGKGQARLVLTKDIDKKSRYVTLSHCWGGDVPFQLKSEKLAELINGFMLHKLPETFRQAIEVAGWAGGKPNPEIPTK